MRARRRLLPALLVRRRAGDGRGAVARGGGADPHGQRTAAAAMSNPVLLNCRLSLLRRATRVPLLLGRKAMAAQRVTAAAMHLETSTMKVRPYPRPAVRTWH